MNRSNTAPLPPQALGNPAPMTGEEYKAAVEAIGLSVRSASGFLGIHERTSYGYRAGDAVPKPIMLLLRTLVALGLTARDVDPPSPRGTLTARPARGHSAGGVK